MNISFKTSLEFPLLRETLCDQSDLGQVFQFYLADNTVIKSCFGERNANFLQSSPII